MANRHFSYPQLEALWIRAGGPRRMAPVMAAIGEVESHGDSAPTPGKTGNNPATATGLPGAIGVWQEEWPLYENALPGLTSPDQLLDPLTNARLAVKLAGNDPSTMPGHPVYDNWIQWEGDISGQPAYLHYLSPGARPAPGPAGSPGSGADSVSFGGLALIAVFVLAGAAAAVIGTARAARSTRGQTA